MNLNLKEPVTNTRMWSRSIPVATDTVTFDTDDTFPPGITFEVARAYVLQEPALSRALIPKLEAMYQKVFTTADRYLNKDEVQSVATQAADVRKKALITVAKH